MDKPGATTRARARLFVAQVAFSSARTGLLRDGAGRIWRTTNGGRRWSALRSVGSERIRGMATGAGDSAYLVVDSFGTRIGGYLLHSADGGATWGPQFVVDAPIQPHGIAAPGGSVDYLLAGETGLLSSTTGGNAGDASTVTIATKRRRLPKARRITVTGRLSPAGATAQVVVSMLPPGATRWVHQTRAGVLERLVRVRLAGAARHDGVRRAVDGQLQVRGRGLPRDDRGGQAAGAATSPLTRRAWASRPREAGSSQPQRRRSSCRMASGTRRGPRSRPAGSPRLRAEARIPAFPPRAQSPETGQRR